MNIITFSICYIEQSRLTVDLLLPAIIQYGKEEQLNRRAGLAGKLADLRVSESADGRATPTCQACEREFLRLCRLWCC